MIEILLACVGKIFVDVLKDIFNSPAKEISIETISGDIELPTIDTAADYGL